jgi:hypothetical protein
MSEDGTEDLLRWLQDQPLLQRCLVCGEPATGIGVVVPHEGLAVCYAGCGVHREPAVGTLRALQALMGAAPEINVADTDVSVH